jgi:dTDP-4-amino-4,6-dideoxygalactose transaminase
MSATIAVSRVRSANLAVTDPVLRQQLTAAFHRVLDHGMMLLGPEVEAFERRFAAACGTPLAVGVASGSSAVYMALKGLGIGPGDEVITTPMSWIATLNAVRMTGATPVFVDIGEDLNMDMALLEAAITPRTKAILVVHYTGRLCDMTALMDIAGRHRLLVVEDAAQAFGARMNGKVAGGFGDAGAFSLNPMKVLHGYGEAGAVTMHRPEVKARVESLRYLGTIDKEVCVDIDLNHKIDAIQAALLTVSLDWFEGWAARRHANARRYWERLGGLVSFPEVPAKHDWRSVYFDMTVVTDRRDQLKQHLLDRGIEVKIKHPILMPDQPAHADLSKPVIPIARRLVERILTLPVHDNLLPEEVDYVCDCVEEFFR